MANVRITQLPVAPDPISGAELVPIVQNGQTVQTTVNDLVNSPTQTQTFLTVDNEPSLSNSRYFAVGTGLGIADGGAQSSFQVFLNGTSGSLESIGTGIVAKTAANTVAARSISVGSGLAISNADGVAGDPSISVSGLLSALVATSGTGLLGVVGGTNITTNTVSGVSDEISVTNGNTSPIVGLASDPIIPGNAGAVLPVGTSTQRALSPVNGTVRYNNTTSRFEGYQGNAWGNLGTGDGTVSSVSGTANQITVSNPTTTPVLSLSTDAVLPGSGSVTLPKGGTAARSGTPVNGMLRYNTDTALFEGYINSAWTSLASGSGVTSVSTGTGLTGGPITSTGTISIDNTVVATLSDTQTLTNKTISGSSNTLTNISNGSLTNSSVTINGSNVSLGGSTTITATATNALTIGTGLSGTSYNGSTPVTIAIDSTVATLTGSQTLTNKSISASTNTLTNIPNSALTNSSVTVGTTAIALGASSLVLGGLTTVSVTQDPTSAFELATKQYVDGLVSTGLTYHQPVQVATTQDLATQTGGLVVYNNGSSGVGATLTLTVALTTLDGYSLSNGDRILVKNETNQAYNGVYTWATGGLVLTRSTDTDTYGTGTGDLSENDYFFVQNGTVNKGNSFVCTTVGTIVFGTTAITFSQFSTSQVYTGTSPIQVSGTVISLNTVPVASGGTNITSYSTGDLLYASGSTTLSKLAIGATNYVLASSGTTPQYVAQSTLSVGSATNATNTEITANSTNATNYMTFVSATTGNLGQLVNSSITCNPSTGVITGGISGGTF